MWSIENTQRNILQAMEGVHKDALGEEPRPAASSSFISVLAGVLQKSEGEHLHRNT